MSPGNTEDTETQMSYHYNEKVDGFLPTHDKAIVAARLRELIPDLQLLENPEDLRPFECDGLAAYRTTPMLVALPDKVVQVEALLKYANEHKIAVVARCGHRLVGRGAASRKGHFASDGAL